MYVISCHQEINKINGWVWRRRRIFRVRSEFRKGKTRVPAETYDVFLSNCE